MRDQGGTKTLFLQCPVKMTAFDLLTLTQDGYCHRLHGFVGRLAVFVMSACWPESLTTTQFGITITDSGRCLSEGKTCPRRTIVYTLKPEVGHNSCA